MGTFKISGNYVKKHCQFCNHTTTAACLPRHEKHCYLNPINIRHCPVCNKVIKNYKTNKTCSTGCANTLFRSGKNNPNWKPCKEYINSSNVSETGYKKICFTYHKKECVICKESHIVEVHHLDENKGNNLPNNLIPLCPTHHQYWHSKYKYLIENDVNNYINNFSQNEI